VTFHGVTVLWSTAEIARVAEQELEFRLTQSEDAIALQTARTVLPDAQYKIEHRGDHVLLVSRKHARVDDRLVVRFR